MSSVDPRTIKEVLMEPDWIAAMQEELEEFKRNQVWQLVSKPKVTLLLVPDGCIRTNWMNPVRY